MAPSTRTAIDPHARRQLVRAVIASTIGSTIEGYDVFIYGLLVPLYLGKLFFPTGDPVKSSTIGLAVLLVSFGCRPIGGALFGHFGDRAGRKATLIATLLLGGLAVFASGLLPTYAQIGIWAPIALIASRVLIGLSIGGEWGGAVLLSMEWSERPRRGLRAAWPQAAVPAAILLGFAAIAGARALVGPGSDLAWRLPFLASILLVLVGLYVRLGVLETPSFTRLLESGRIERAPVLSVLQRNWREVLLTASLRLGEQAPAVVFTIVFLTLAGPLLHLSQGTAITIAMISAAVGMVATPIAGWVADMIGRRATFSLGLVAMFTFALPYWLLLGSGNLALIAAAAITAQILVAWLAGSNAAFIAEAFTGRLRYSGASMGAGIGAFFSGGLASVLALGLYQRFHSPIPIGVYLMFCCVASFIGAQLLRERSHQDLSGEYDEKPRPIPGATVAGA